VSKKDKTIGKKMYYLHHGGKKGGGGEQERIRTGWGRHAPRTDEMIERGIPLHLSPTRKEAKRKKKINNNNSIMGKEKRYRGGFRLYEGEGKGAQGELEKKAKKYACLRDNPRSHRLLLEVYLLVKDSKEKNPSGGKKEKFVRRDLVKGSDTQLLLLSMAGGLCSERTRGIQSRRGRVRGKDGG